MPMEQIDRPTREESTPSPREGEERRLAAHMRAIAAITPAVAHDLRAPINSMVFNLEILKETLTGSLAGEPNAKERQARYVNVLREELGRLHRALETWLAQTAERGRKVETVDLAELLGELAALLVPPGRKQQVQVAWEAPPAPAPVEGVRHLLKQALLLVGLAALERAPSGTTLALRLHQRDGRTSATIGGEAAASPDARFAPRAAAGGGLDVARDLVAESGGALWGLGRADAPAGYELEWPAA